MFLYYFVYHLFLVNKHTYKHIGMIQGKDMPIVVCIDLVTLCLNCHYIFSVGSASRNCKCTEQCNSTVFEPVMSYGALSSLSVDHIMSDRPPDLHTKYLHALNIQNHVNQKKYADDIALLQKIEHTYSEIYKYLQKYTDRNSKASAFSKLIMPYQLLMISFGEIEIPICLGISLQ